MKNLHKLVNPRWILPHLAAGLPALWLAWAWQGDALGINPIQAATQFSGRTALTMLAFSLACTPLHTLFGWRYVLPWRRSLGLYAFVWAAVHLFFFVWVDYGLDWAALHLDVGGKPYVWVGALAMLILAALAFTSHRWWMKHLKRRWKALHRLVYLAAALVLVHYFWVAKGNFWGLNGNIVRPLIYSAAVGLLLALRVPAIRQRLVRLRGHVHAARQKISRRSDTLRRAL
ncbi:MAG: ferric reductase-like transmembrane domain-containing protein [Anaerolineales bacterium]